MKGHKIHRDKDRRGQDSLADELDATFLELERLTEQWEQAQSFERSLERVRFMSAQFETLIEEVRRVRASVSQTAWIYISQVLQSELPKEFDVLGKALVNDERFWRVILYLGFVRGALASETSRFPHQEGGSL